LFKKTRGLSAKSSVDLVLGNLFGVPAKEIPLYHRNDVGLSIPIRNKSTILPSKEQATNYMHLQAYNFHRFLTSQTLGNHNRRFLMTLERNLKVLEIGHQEWVDLPDLYGFLQEVVSRASIETLLGSKILELSPTLVKDLWTFQAGTPMLLRKMPRLAAPSAYEARDRLIESIKKWHAYLLKHVAEDKLKPDQEFEWEPVWGSGIVRKRMQDMAKLGQVSADGHAADDVGFLFA